MTKTQKTQLKSGDSIRDIFGKWHTVDRTHGTTVWVLNGGTVHITKITRIIKGS